MQNKYKNIVNIMQSKVWYHIEVMYISIKNKNKAS